jgi:hypothetical protein
MKAGKPISGYWATPAPGLRTEFEVDFVEEGFISFSPVCIPVRCLSGIPQISRRC